MTDQTINTEQKPAESSNPNDTAGFYFTGALKITDPETKETLVHTRID